jgi:hypothetical protein
MTLDVKKRNSSNETPNVMTVGVEKYGLSLILPIAIPFGIEQTNLKNHNIHFFRCF